MCTTYVHDFVHDFVHDTPILWGFTPIAPKVCTMCTTFPRNTVLLCKYMILFTFS